MNIVVTSIEAATPARSTRRLSSGEMHTQPPAMSVERCLLVGIEVVRGELQDSRFLVQVVGFVMRQRICAVLSVLKHNRFGFPCASRRENYQGCISWTCMLANVYGVSWEGGKKSIIDFDYFQSLSIENFRAVRSGKDQFSTCCIDQAPEPSRWKVWIQSKRNSPSLELASTATTANADLRKRKGTGVPFRIPRSWRCCARRDVRLSRSL